MNAQQIHDDFGCSSECRRSGCPEEGVEMVEQSDTRSGVNFLTPTNNPILCGQDEAVQRVYRIAAGHNGRIWLYAVQPNAGENIYVSGGPNSKGFGGSTLTFKLEDGSEMQLQGPWHSNAVDLLKETGIDLLDTFLTFGAIGHDVRHLEPSYVNKEIIDVIYRDEVATLGTIDRITVLAQQIADERGHPVFYWKRSAGMISSGFIKPQMKLEDAATV